MKFIVTFKTPDAVDNAFARAADNACQEEFIDLIELDNCVENCVSKFVKNGEYVSIMFDDETMTATVIPVKK